jgi:hypothetical protein
MEIPMSATFNEVHDALCAYAEEHSKAEANRVMERVTGKSSLGDVHPSKYRQLIAALEGEAIHDIGDGVAEHDAALRARNGGEATAFDTAAAMMKDGQTLDTEAIYRRFNTSHRGRTRGESA